MTTEEFKAYWENNYSDSYPIDYEMKHVFNERWFRIHSLPDSKRYADNEADYDILLKRQNDLISDLFTSNDFHIITGFFKHNKSEKLTDDYFDLETFQKLDTLELHKIRPEEYHDDKMYYDIFLKSAKWKLNDFNSLLIKIADGERRAMFVNMIVNITIVPYDGGMDVILPDSEIRDKYKIKYKDWLSLREDGL